MLEVIACAGGALVMILEMTASRILAPHLGTSLVVWTSLIGVVLAFMALGAWIGGRAADRRPSTRLLARILAAAGLAVAATASVHPWVGARISEAFPGLHAAALTASVLLLGAPSILFGMVTPFVIRLRLKSVGTSGGTVGRLYALSTAGSIAGTFLGGFVLVAWFGSTQILFGVGAAMFILAALAVGRIGFGGAAATAALLCSAALSQSYGVPRLADGRPALTETPYNALIVREGRTADGRAVRVLVTDPGKAQAAVYPDQPEELVFPYTWFFGDGAALMSTPPSRILMLGGGGYSMVRNLLRPAGPLGPGVRLDVVELDPGMTRVAREYFGIPDDPGLRIVHEDARRFLNRSTETYDLIYVDVFSSEFSVPFHTATVEAAAALRRCTSPDGVVLINIISALEGQGGRLLQAVRGSLRTAFAHVETFAVHDPDSRDQAQNIILVAYDAAVPTWPDRFAAHRVIPDEEGVPPLLDDYAPVERYVLPLLKR